MGEWFFVPEGQHDRSHSARYRLLMASLARSAWAGVWTFPESGDPLERGISQKVAKITKSELRRANGFLSRRDSMIVARHEVLGKASSRKNVP
jgi:hypothetical protein